MVERMVTDVRALDGDEVVALARKILTVAPLLRRVQPERVLLALGYPQLETVNEFSRFGDAGLGVGPASVGLAADGSAETVAVPVHAPLPRPLGPEHRDFVQDVFSMAGRALIAHFGEPAGLSGGGSPALKWHFGESALTLVRGGLDVALYLWRTIDLEGDE
ncbi:hypothetical protein GCM10018962_97140 [Dactylosporangium matsuzakiense]|uniref:Uncharacterized protein n=2 Tax=Dactylosporangium matsuzakiense TaxID=53360 RepID=A0A9W6NSP8_9ACTN|nr:hypothetical protein GCM10017581_093100 [Dactylosporangium matsuzakiense]